MTRNIFKNYTQISHHIYISQPMFTYLGLLQTPKGFKQIAQIATHAIQVLKEKKFNFTITHQLRKLCCQFKNFKCVTYRVVL